jgi:hypothetical protein
LSYLTRLHKQDILYWAFSSRDAQGAETFSTPVAVKGRWEDGSEKFLNKDGDEEVSNAIVYLGQDVAEGDWLFLGVAADIASSEGTTDPTLVTGAKEIRKFNKTPDYKGTSFERRIIL